MRDGSVDVFEDWQPDVCLCAFWWERNQRWATFGERPEAATLGWRCPAHGVVTANGAGGFGCRWPRVASRPEPVRRERRQPAQLVLFEDVA